MVSLLPLLTIADLDAAVQASTDRPIVIFKHSLTCGTSAMAVEEVQNMVDDPAVHAPVYVVVIQQARDVSWEIERRFAVRHESPQALVVSGGKVVWHASHFRVTAEAVRRAVDANARTYAPTP